MTDTSNPNSQTKSQAKLSSSQSSDLASLRKSNRPKKPSLLYADGFEDTQKVIGRKINNSKNTRPSNKNNIDTLSASEKEQDTRMEEEITERVGGFPERIEYDDEDEYLPFILSEEVDNDTAGKVAFVSFKVQTGEENRSTQRSSTSNEATGYQMRKNKKKSVYHEDYSYANEPKKTKEKTKNIQTLQAKKGKSVTKTAVSLPASHDFLDIVLSAAIKAQASQTQNVELNVGPKSPRNNHTQNNNEYRTSGKFSAPRVVEEKPSSVVKKQKVSVKKTESNKPSHQPPDEFYQRHLEYKDHYIKEAVVNDDTVTFKHTKVPPVSMKYAKRKFVFREKEIVESKLFNMAMGVKGESEMDEENDGLIDEDWLKKLKLKENVLALHFKGLLRDYKPSILV